MILSSLVRLYDRSVGSVYSSLYTDLDVVKVLPPVIDPNPDSPPSKSVLNQRYLLPCLLYSAYLLDTLCLLLWRPSQWSFSGNATSDGTFARKLLPPSVSQQADVFFLELTAMLLTGTVHLLFHNMEPFERQFRMFATLSPDGNLLKMTQKGRGKEICLRLLLFFLHFLRFFFVFCVFLQFF